MKKLFVFLVIAFCLSSCLKKEKNQEFSHDAIEETIQADTLPLGVQFLLDCNVMLKDSCHQIMKEYQFEVPCVDSCYHSLTAKIRMQYPEIPASSITSYENNNGLRRFYSCQLCDWVESFTGEKSSVCIPKTFTWTSDSLALYYGNQILDIVHPKLEMQHDKDEFHFEGGFDGEVSISMFEVFRNEKYATICVYEHYGLSGMYHYYYKYSYYTVDVNDSEVVYLHFKSIFKEDSTNDVLQKLAHGLVEARFGLGKQVEDYCGDYSELITDHVALVSNGVLFYYAPYEEGCFSEGQINVILPYDSVASYLQPDILSFVVPTVKTII